MSARGAAEFLRDLLRGILRETSPAPAAEPLAAPNSAVRIIKFVFVNNKLFRHRYCQLLSASDALVFLEYGAE